MRLGIYYWWHSKSSLKYYNTYHKAVEFEVGSKAMLSTHFIALSKNFKPRFIGPYKVLNCIDNQAYKLSPPPSLAK